MFDVVTESRTSYGLRLLTPDLSTFQPVPLIITLVSFVLLQKFKVGMIPVLLGSAIVGATYFLLN
jgi:hypothetical protein